MSNLSDFLTGKGYGLKEVLTSSSTWNWVNAGKPKKILVRMIAGSGGNAQSATGSAGGAGGNSVWDTTAVVATTTATGGNGAATTARATTLSGMPNASGGTTNNAPQLSYNILNSHYGCPNSATSSYAGSDVWQGGYGELKEFEYVPTGTVTYTIGAGGTEGNTNLGAGNQGAIELYY